jgi:hypothetical protein
LRRELEVALDAQALGEARADVVLRPRHTRMGERAPEVVARGESELGIAQGSEIVPVAGAKLVGPLPGDLASTTVFAAAIGAASKSPEAANSFIPHRARGRAPVESQRVRTGMKLGLSRLPSRRYGPSRNQPADVWNGSCVTSNAGPHGGA